MEPSTKPCKLHQPLIKDFRLLGRHIALIGGTFDPVHRGHLAMGEAILAHAHVDAVVFIPAWRNPLKENSPVASDPDRIEMLRRALEGNTKFFVSPLEVERKGVSYTVDTLREVQSLAQPGANLVFICGADQLATLHQWKEYETIFKLAKVRVLGRDGITADDIKRLGANLPGEIQRELSDGFIPFYFPAAATNLRHQLLSGDLATAKNLLPLPVFEMIQNRGLYARDRSKN